MRLVLLHAGAGLSLRQATARAKVQGLTSISDVALLKRLRSAESWLRWMTRELLRRSRYGSEFLTADTGRRLRVVDATAVQEPGATGTSWCVHYSLSLPSLVCDFFEVTDKRGEETHKRLPIQNGDLVLADRGCCHREGAAYVKEHGGDVVLRLNTTNFPLTEGKTDQPFPLLRRLRTLQGRRPEEWAVGFKASSGAYTGRLCAIRKSAASARAWIQAKLLAVLLIERLQEEACLFSPWGFPIHRQERLA